MRRPQKIKELIAEIDVRLHMTRPEQIEAAIAKREEETGIPRAQFGIHKISIRLLDDWGRDALAEERRRLEREYEKLPKHEKAD